jgi:hypothetical protein
MMGPAQSDCPGILRRFRSPGKPPALVGIGAVLDQLDIDKANKYYGEYRGYGDRYYRKYGYASDATQGAEAMAATAEDKAT